MSRIEASILINASPEEVFAFHDDPRNLNRVLPSYLRVDIVDAPRRLSQGSFVQCVIHIGPLRFDWKNEIVEYAPPRRFVDVQRGGPFARYLHTHVFDSEEGATRLTDVIEYELALGPLAELASRIGFRSQLKGVLAHGQRATKAFIERPSSVTRRRSSADRSKYRAGP